jgi:fluoroquinolone resistance protein
MIPAQTPPDPFADELIEDKVFSDLDLRGREISDKIFRECRFSNVTFAEARLRECRFEDCLVRLSDWTMAKVYGTALRGVKFEGCKLMGIDWSDGHRALGASFKECVLDYASFARIDLRKVAFKDCRMLEVNFAEANLSEADFSGSNLDRSRFQRTNLTRANLAGAANFLINPADNKTKGAIISLDAAVSIVSAMGMTVSGFGDASKRRGEP